MNSTPHQPPRPGLIFNAGPVSPRSRGPLPRPGVAVVYATREGDAIVLPRRPSMVDVLRYQGWHQVDVSRHQDTVTADVPSQVDSMGFQLRAEVVWGVTDPAMIVQNNTMDGIGLVQSRLLDRSRRLTRKFDIDDCPAAEERLQRDYDAGPIGLPEGLTIFSAALWLRVDDATARFQAEQRELVRAGINDDFEYSNKRKREQQEAKLEQERMAALRKTAKGEDDLLFVFLSRHPDQVGTVLQLVAQRREMTQKAQLALFDKMVSEGFIQEADIEPMRQLLLRPMERFVDSSSLNVLGSGATQPAALDPGSATAAPATPSAAEPPPADNPPRSDPPKGRQTPAANGVAGWVPFKRDSDDGGSE
jgi:hypothetical protein